MMRVYLSGPMTSDPEYMGKFTGADQFLRNQGYHVANPAELYRVLPDNATYEELLNLDLQILAMCDALVQLPGWEKSCGANREYGYALAMDKLIVDYALIKNDDKHISGKEK